MIVADTHVWIWWLHDREKLSVAANRALDAADVVAVSAISCLEIATLIRRQRLEVEGDGGGWIRRAISHPRLTVVPVTPYLATRAGLLSQGFHGDPCDRLIVATAIEHEAKLVTRDDRIRDFPGVKTIW